MSNDLFRRNRLRALRSDPVGIEYTARQNKGSVTAQFGASQTSPADVCSKLQTAKGFTYPFTVTNVSQQLLPIDLNRTFLNVVNTDPLGNFTLSFGNPQPYGVGVPCAAGGGAVFMDQHVPTAAVYVIGNIANNPNVSLTVA
jgi:hypothetical protein